MTFLLVLAPSPPWYPCGSLGDGSLYSQCVILVLDSRRSRADLFLKELCLCLSVLICMMVTWRTDERHLPFFCLTQNSLRKVSGGKAVAFLKNNLRQRIIQQLLRAKDYNCDKQQSAEILGGKAKQRLSLGN